MAKQQSTSAAVALISTKLARGPVSVTFGHNTARLTVSRDGVALTWTVTYNDAGASYTGTPSVYGSVDEMAACLPELVNDMAEQLKTTEHVALSTIDDALRAGHTLRIRDGNAALWLHLHDVTGRVVTSWRATIMGREHELAGSSYEGVSVWAFDYPELVDEAYEYALDALKVGEE